MISSEAGPSLAVAAVARQAMGALPHGRAEVFLEADQPTEQQMRYARFLEDRYGVFRPRGRMTRGQVSRWIDQVKARHEAYASATWGGSGVYE